MDDEETNHDPRFGCGMTGRPHEGSDMENDFTPDSCRVCGAVYDPGEMAWAAPPSPPIQGEG